MLIFVVLSYLFMVITSTPLQPASTIPSPPDPSNAALMARYIVHNSDWASIATTSTLSNIKNYPFVNLKSLSDGPPSNGTGVPYVYMTQLDLTGRDVEKSNRVTIMVTLAQSEYCKEKAYDPQDPRCGRTIIVGRLLKVPESAPDYKFAKNSLFSRHPEMKTWPTDHDFYVAKINVEQILVLDQFGGVKYVSVKDYFNPPTDATEINRAKITEIVEEDKIFVFNILK